MRKILPILALLLALVLVPSAQARVVELGADALPEAKPSCPETCQGLGFVTGYMGRSGKASNPFRVTAPGRIVAFTDLRSSSARAGSNSTLRSWDRVMRKLLTSVDP